MPSVVSTAYEVLGMQRDYVGKEIRRLYNEKMKVVEGNIPTIRELVEDGVQAVIGKSLTKDQMAFLLRHPDVKLAADRDAEEHRAWGLAHGSMDKCELEHRHLGKVMETFWTLFGSE